MNVVDQTNWHFCFSNSSPFDEALGETKDGTILEFGAAAELVHHLIGCDNGELTQIQNAIQERIKQDPVALQWRGIRTLLKNLKHFPKYRSNKYDEYHEASRACASGKGTNAQKALAQGLEAEIDQSQIVIPAGQILFHGRSNRDVTNSKPYPTFISTSLDPVVALLHAVKRAGRNSENGQPTIYILTLQCALQALWGQTGNSFEFELLLPPKLTSIETNVSEGGKFDVVEADVLCKG